MTQFDLFAWADSKPSNIVDVMPALIRKAALETMYDIPRPKGEAKIVTLTRRAA
ncbi:hypothetical protein [Mesorhizobium sp. ANAO-SY3R2]|uniref:hypothetical protein n=1 Tax=Mesorhizobium sp. ANAO-SY3R2 TaxID=3166644 RepID=UPI00366E7157